MSNLVKLLIVVIATTIVVLILLYIFRDRIPIHLKLTSAEKKRLEELMK